MFPAVVLRQHRARLAGLGRQGALAQLASNGRETGDSHGETAGPGAAHRPSIMPDADGDSQPDGGSSARRLAVSVEERDLSGRISQHSPRLRQISRPTPVMNLSSVLL